MGVMMSDDQKYYTICYEAYISPMRTGLGAGCADFLAGTFSVFLTPRRKLICRIATEW